MRRERTMRSIVFLSLVAAVIATPLQGGRALQSRNPEYRRHSLHTRDLPIGTCNAQTPCPNGACCGSNGLCGYSPTECGSGCTSNCDAKAQCGQYGTPGSQDCPLNVCCSQFGFCGATEDFCGTGCQTGYGGCGAVPTPACGGSQVGKRTIGYYESWANTRKCQAVSPDDLNLAGFTHLNFAFASFDPSSFKIAPMDPNSGALFGAVTGLKNKWPGLEVWISVGGWAFTDPGPTQEAFSNMVSSSGNRQAFITNLLQFMNTYNFDGVDLDWEYPQADDRGGQPGDKANYVSLAQELRAALGSKGLSMTLPTSYWYLQHFDVNILQQSVDWFNFMAYDLHGTWDAASKFVGPYIAPHTNLTEIDEGLSLLWRAGVEANKVVLGQGWYGRSFQLADPSCSTPNGVCQFVPPPQGGANPGPCSDTSGILDDQEIDDIIAQNNLQPVWDQTAGVKWITWDSNQWVSYDDADTFNQKREFAQARCLGGLMVWAIDQKSQNSSGNLNSGSQNQVSAGDQSTAQQMSQDQMAKASCYVTDCDQSCKVGTNPVAQMNGQPGQISTRDRCKKGQYRTLCCDDGTTLGQCQWRGYRGSGLSCIQGCAEGETELTTDTNNHSGKKDQTCNGGLQSYCCSGFKAPPNLAQIEKDAADAAKAAAEAAAEQAALDLAAKAFCRIAVPALLAPLEALEDLIPIIGEIADVVEIAATPGLIKLCTDEIEKSGKAEFKVFGKEHSLEPDEPGDTTPETRPPQSSHEPEKTSSDCNSKRADNPGYCLAPRTQTETNQPVVTEHPGVIKLCDGERWPQPCLHYRSVIQSHALFTEGVNPLTCATSYYDGYDRPAVNEWIAEHNNGWWQGYIQEPDQACQKDEYPPAAFWWYRADTIDHAYIRLLPGGQNGGAGSLFKQSAICGYDNKNGLAPRSTRNLRSDREVIQGNRKTIIETLDLTVTLSTVSVSFINMPDYADDGLTENPCWPSTVVDDPGFALLTEDPWYIHNPNKGGLRPQYPFAPANQYTAGKYQGANYQRRDEYFDEQQLEAIITAPHSSSRSPMPADIFFSDGNSTRRATDEDLARHMNLHRCATPDCREEVGKYDVEAILVHPDVARALVVEEDEVLPATSTTQDAAADTIAATPTAASGAERTLPGLPRPT